MTPDRDREPELRVVDRRWWARPESGAPAAEQETPAPAASVKPTYVEDLERRVAEIAGELQNARVEYRRSLEEFEQVKSRLRRDIAREVERGRRGVILEFLDVLDNLDRAIAAAGQRADADAATGPDAVARFARGVELVRDQFLARLEALGVTRLRALGQPFDADRHEAVTTTVVGDPAQDQTVVAVVHEGYAVGGDLLRPAAVVFGRYQP
jgi:molecular chaperone GrpE